jgi:mannose-1-phosphate guanylyltransferase
LIQDTVDRIGPLIPLERVRILTGDRLAGSIRAAVPGLEEEHLLLEPRAAGTAPVLAWAAVQIERIDPDAVMISLHADHVIEPSAKFREQIAAAASLATAHGRLFTIGAVPDRPETGYGYIRVGDRLPHLPQLDSVAFDVEKFVEKPDYATACKYLEDGGYLWNTGIFVWRVRDLLTELERHTPEVARLIPLLRQGDVTAFFDQVPTLSIDEGLLERSDRIGVLPADFHWDDIGAWDAVFRTRPHDVNGNVVIGDAHLMDSHNCAIYADGGPVVAFGVDDLIVVRTAGITFVTHRQKSADLKQLIERIPERLRRLD